MFYLTVLSKNLSLTPQNLGIDIKDLISKKIRELEGKVVGNHGYVISILEFNQTGLGVVDNELGNVNFKTEYKAITFKPTNGEILMAIPNFINEHGFFCNVGPLLIFVSKYALTEDGEDWKFEDEKWIFEDREITIGEPVNLEIIASRTDSNEIKALGKLV